MKYWLNIKDAATYAGVTPQTMSKWLDDGLIHSRIGRLVRIKPDNIDAYLDSHISKPFDINKLLEGVR